ncbi:hypothetical protein AQS8620_00284 [Aquimixticola soesokkakensis]|uniref:Exopolysaccharide biosynthesis protein YbjH n=1 Tax=Aquimixticola soesokkakensis TaxID=1519096 RepID=A0A1Y5RIE9_9RHOB|nr:YjbH domain-containing protein [Aquimixticola soesokkakensis]SLN15450.1 hypothetical protein AQS8620_00284 [Aquimixticola soesokkakensis]
MRARHYLAGGVSFLAALSAVGVDRLGADPLTSTAVNTYGTQGIIDMPSAEVAPDAQLSVTYAKTKNAARTTITFQATERLSLSFRYAGIEDYADDYDTYTDRSFDLRYQIAGEGTYRPAIAIGLQDFMGTGVYSGEYLAATKTLGDKLTVTGGLGWGRLASHGAVFSMGTRETDFVETGGVPNVKQWFTGDVAPFAGLRYQYNDKLALVAEYSSDAYVVETQRGLVDVNTPLNFGAEYKVGRNWTLAGYALYGAEVGARLSYSVNPKHPRIPGGTQAAPMPVAQRPAPAADPLGWSGRWIEDGTDAPGIRKALKTALAKESIILESASLSATRAEVRIRNQGFGAPAEALGRTARIMSRAYPPSVETFVITEVSNGAPLQSTIINRSALERLENRPAGEMLAATQFADPKLAEQLPVANVEGLYPDLQWSLSPYITASVFDPDSPVRADAGIAGRVNYRLGQGLYLGGSVTGRITGNLSEAKPDPNDNPDIPNVRSDSSFYNQDRFHLEDLTLAWYTHPAKNVFSRVTIGQLERMYGGVSTEVLWKRPESRLAFGVEVNYAKQRDYSDPFAFRDYDIVTGHASAYYDLGNGYHGEIDAGRYLAGDWGTTISLDREFNNGWRIGGYATFTDISFDDFGEGSFDKGFRITIPTQFVANAPSPDRTNLLIKSLTRDGGARLSVQGRLYETVRQAQQPEIEDRWGRFWR